MKQTPSPVKRLWELAGAHRRAYALSIILAILGVACGMIPYFAIAYIMLCLIDGVTSLNTYALWCGVILLGFTLKLLFSTLSTTVSHTATFQTLKEVRIKIADKLSRVPMGYIMDQSSGRFKDVIVDRVESMEPILAHLVPEMTSNLFVPLCIIVYLFILDWRMALASLVTLPIGFLCYMGMSRGYSERFSGLMKRVQKMNATIIEYVGGIEVIKAFNQSANSYQKYSDAVNDDACYAVDWMKDTQLFMSMSNTIWPSVWLAVLPIGAVLYQHGTLSAPVFLTIMILSLGIVGPILGAIKFTDNISQLGTIVGEVGNLLDAPEMVRPDHDADIHDLSIHFQDVSFSYDLKDPKPILDHINLTIQPGTMTALVGPSGSGKSTLGNAINGLIPHSMEGKAEGSQNSHQGDSSEKGHIPQGTAKAAVPHRPGQHQQAVPGVESYHQIHIPPTGDDEAEGGCKDTQQSARFQLFKPVIPAEQKDDSQESKALGIGHGVGDGVHEQGPKAEHQPRRRKIKGMPGLQHLTYLFRHQKNRIPGRKKTAQEHTNHKGLDAVICELVENADKQVGENFIVGPEQVIQQHRHTVETIGSETGPEKVLFGPIVDVVVHVKGAAIENQPH